MNGRFQPGNPATPVAAGKRLRASRSLRASTRRKPSKTLADIAKRARRALAYQPLLPCSTAPMAKPPQFNTSDTGAFKRAVDMTDHELAAIAARAKLTIV